MKLRFDEQKLRHAKPRKPTPYIKSDTEDLELRLSPDTGYKLTTGETVPNISDSDKLC